MMLLSFPGESIMERTRNNTNKMLWEKAIYVNLTNQNKYI